MGKKGKSAVTTSSNLFQYLRHLHPNAKLRLYADPSRGTFVCKAVLQYLPDLARQMVFRLASNGSGIFGREECLSWTTSRAQGLKALTEMEDFCVILPQQPITEEDPKQKQIVQLSKQFLLGIQGCITSLKSTPWPSADIEEKARGIKEVTRIPPTANDLEFYTQRRWDSVLHYLVGSTDYTEDPPSAVVTFLQKTGLMQKDSEFGLVISSKGYEFMLQDVRLQVWLFIVQYLSSFESNRRCEDIRHEAILFLISLSYCRVGEGYPWSLLSKDAVVLCRDLSQFGLVYLYNISNDPKNKDAIYFYPTRVAINLIAGSTASISDIGTPSISSTRALNEALTISVPGTSHLAIIVQTNFQICAYTTSELHVSMLGLFCDETQYRRLPNVCFFKITRDSVKSAFRLGIGAGQILQFLKMNAHPRLRNGGPLIPSNIEDQILLWDRERKRVEMEEVWLLQCSGHEEFVAAQQFSIDVGAHAWSSEEKNTVMIRYSQTEPVMAFVHKWRARQTKKRRRS